jgi:hypothetical protein
MGPGGMRQLRKAPLAARAISKLASCVASIVNRGTLSPIAIGRQFSRKCVDAPEHSSELGEYEKTIPILGDLPEACPRRKIDAGASMTVALKGG